MYFDVTAGFIHVNVIVIFEYVKAMDWVGEEFSKLFTNMKVNDAVKNSYCKVMNLTKEEDIRAIDCGKINTRCMCCRYEGDFMDDTINMDIPEM